MTARSSILMNSSCGRSTLKASRLSGNAKVARTPPPAGWGPPPAGSGRGPHGVCVRRCRSGSFCAGREAAPPAAHRGGGRPMRAWREPFRVFRRRRVPGIHRGRWPSALPAGLPHRLQNSLERGGFSPSLRLALRLQFLHAPPDQLALERAQVVDEELALQMVHLVLHADREERIGRFLLLPAAVAVRVLDDDVAETRDLLVLVGDGQAAFGVRELAVGDLEHGIDQPEQAFALLLRLLAFGRGTLVHVHRDHVEVYPNLGGGEPDAVGVIHRLGHVVAQLADLRIDLAYGLGLLLQAGVGPDQELSQCHAFSLLGGAARQQYASIFTAYPCRQNGIPQRVAGFRAGRRGRYRSPSALPRSAGMPVMPCRRGARARDPRREGAAATGAFRGPWRGGPGRDRARRGPRRPLPGAGLPTPPARQRRGPAARNCRRAGPRRAGRTEGSAAPRGDAAPLRRRLRNRGRPRRA